MEEDRINMIENELLLNLMTPYVYMFIGIVCGYMIGIRTGIIRCWSDLWYAFFPLQTVPMTDWEIESERQRVNNIGYGILCFILAVTCFVLAVFMR